MRKRLILLALALACARITSAQPQQLAIVDQSWQSRRVLDPALRQAPVRQLLVNGNELSELPEWLGQMSQLEVLWAAQNHLESLPPSAAGLKRLRDIDLSNNRLSQVPTQLFGIDSLRNCALRNNQIRSLVITPKAWKSLEILDLQGNRLERFEGAQHLTSLRLLNLTGTVMSHSDLQHLRSQLPQASLIY